MRVLLLGVGMQGVVALDDLYRSHAVEEIIAADVDVQALRRHVDRMRYDARVRCEEFDARNPASVDRLFAGGADVAIDLLPVDHITRVAESAVRHGVHLVNTFYVPDDLRKLGPIAESAGVRILPEFGMDPGIDLVLLGDTVSRMDEIYEMHSYGGGIPVPEASDNAIRYKISWTFEGVLRSYHHPSRLIVDGEVVGLGADELFNPENVHRVDIDGLGEMEAFTNGDAVQYCERLGLAPNSLRAAGRYSLRWPGHCDFWKKLVDLHLLDDDPVLVDGQAVDRIAYLRAALEPHLQYGEDEQDLAIIRLMVSGRRGSDDVTILHDVIDRKDRDTGFTAMGRLVGFTSSVGAQMLVDGRIRDVGLLSPLKHVPAEDFLAELARRGVTVSTTEV